MCWTLVARRGRLRRHSCERCGLGIESALGLVCSCEAYLEAHHLEHWAQGGETSLSNTTLLCWFHHHEAHEGGFRIERGDDGQLVFFDPIGRPIQPAPAPPLLEGNAIATLVAEQRNAGIAIDRRTSLPDWDGRPLDLDGAVSALVRRSELGAVSRARASTQTGPG